jgi:indole-3-acetate monooxygenase
MPAPFADPLATARALAPEIAARSAEIEVARRLPADLARQMALAGLFRIALPKCLGGLELPPADIIRTIEAVAEADAAVGWCLMIGSTTAVSLAYLPHETAGEIMADPATITGGVFAPMGKAVREGDHYRVTGRWSWGSGTANCAWIFGGCMVHEDGAAKLLPDGKPDHRMMLFPAGEVTLHDTWHAAGLKGTGSSDFSVRNVLVPVERSVSLVSDAPVEPGALYAFPVFGLLALGIAATASGNARAALAALKPRLAAKKPRGVALAEVAKAEASLSSARALLFESVAEAWAMAQASGAIDLETRARLRLAATHMVRTAADVTRAAYDLGGGSAVYLESQLQRRFRDAHAMTQHMMVAPPTYELAGRVLLGLPTDASTL